MIKTNVKDWSVVEREWPIVVLEENDPNDPVVLHELYRWAPKVPLLRLVKAGRILDPNATFRSFPEEYPLSREWSAIGHHPELDEDLHKGIGIAAADIKRRSAVSLMGRFNNCLLVPCGTKDAFPGKGCIPVYHCYRVTHDLHFDPLKKTGKGGIVEDCYRDANKH